MHQLQEKTMAVMSPHNLKLGYQHFLTVTQVLRLPKSSTSGLRSSVGTRVVSVALNQAENVVVGVTDTLQIVAFTFKGLF